MKHLICGLIMAAIFGCKAQDQTHFFNSFDETKIAFTDEGNGDAILLLHGFINTRKNWEKSVLKKELLEKGYRVIAPDLRGNGDSDKPQSDIAYQDFAELKDIIALMDHLKIKQYRAVGYSRGAIILSKLLTMDERITRATIGGVGSDFTNPNWEIPPAFSRAFSGEDKLTKMTEGAVNYAKSINADLKSLSLQQKYQPTTTKQECATINIPLMIISGRQDTSNGNREALQKMISKSFLKYVEGDHNNTYKQENFSKAVIQFLEGK
ncbi:alpha/beta fold hydrolase [Spongiivirga citrea]|uniref:Alpha/beta fold hydrolase n=1 Tax=Spongiivirga citrea TaxID=1481457 RepID=A0A6M0CDP7_9FLAO|nr:alpha/beta fold hydrolase [Spongiivirga citrea]NER15948.1 alpha/beta fold hydrolase [Spongiivirga citrea]